VSELFTVFWIGLKMALVVERQTLAIEEELKKRSSNSRPTRWKKHGRSSRGSFPVEEEGPAIRLVEPATDGRRQAEKNGLEKEPSHRRERARRSRAEASTFIPRATDSTGPLAGEVIALGEGAPSASLTRSPDKAQGEPQPPFSSPPRQDGRGEDELASTW
jgi:hypothetical protein